MKYPGVLLLLFLTLSFPSGAQTVALEGIVQDEEDFGLEGAHIHIGEKYALARKEGYYRIDNLEPGSYNISVTYVGFKTIDTVVSLRKESVINFTLREEEAALSEVIVSGNPRRRDSENKEVVNRQFLQDQFAGSLANTLERLPGLNSVEIGSGASKPIIRGLGFNRVAVTENGIKQEGQQWGADHGLEIDALNTENVEVLKGVGAIEHGSDAMGGVIRIINDRTPREGLAGELTLLGQTVNHGITASSNISYRRGNWFYKVKATGTDFGDYSVPTDQIIYLSQQIPVYNGRLKNTAGEEIDLYGQAGYIGAHYKGTLSISNVYFRAGFFPGAHGVPSTRRALDDGDRRNIEYPFQQVNHFKLINKNEWFLQDFDLELILGYQNNHRQEWSGFHTHYAGQQPPETNPDLELDFNLDTFDAQAKLTKDFSADQRSAIGLQAQLQDNTIGGFNFLLPRYTRSNYGIYLTHEYRVTDDLTLDFGGRFDFSSISIEAHFDPLLFEYLINRGMGRETANDLATRSPDIDRSFSNFNIMTGLLYIMGDNWDFSANTGTSFRLPTAIELGANGIHHGSFRHERGDSNLDPEKGYVLDLQANYRNEKITASLSPYLYYFGNYIFLNPSGQFSVLPHAGQVYQFTQSKAFLTGAELDVQFNFLENWRSQVTLEYLYNRQITSSRSRNYPLPFTPPANGFAEVGYSFFKRSRVLRETEIYLNTAFASEQDRTAQNEQVTPGYQIFGGGLKTAFQAGQFSADVHLQVSNAFNTRYFNHTNFYRALEIPEMGRNIQLMLRIPLN